MKKYVCKIWATSMIPKSAIRKRHRPGTAFEDLPEDWVCPCGVGKEDFEPVE